MRSDDNILKNTKKWLTDNQYSQAWLASQMDVAPSLISQLFNGERKLQPGHIEKIARIMNKTIVDLTSSAEDKVDEPVYSLRGQISSREGERALAQLLLDVEHYGHLSA